MAHLEHYKDSPSKVKSKCDSAVLGFKKLILSKLRVSTVSLSSSLSLLELLRHYCYFPEILDAILSFPKVIIFPIPIFLPIFESGNFRFPFCYEKSQTWEVKSEKFSFRKTVYEWNSHLESFSLLLANRKF